jgi:hypothetical protein
MLESQNQFTTNAFTTGVQGAGQTMRTAMQVGQQQQEALMRNKTTLQEGAANRASQMETLQAKLKSDRELATEATAQRKIEADAATAQRKIEADKLVRAREIEAAAAAKRESDEFDRRKKIADDAAKKANMDALAKAEADLEAADNKWNAYMAKGGDKGSDYYFTDSTEDEFTSEEFFNEQTGQYEYRDKVSKRGSSQQAREMQERYDYNRSRISAELDPVKRAALINSLIQGGAFDYTKSRAATDTKFREAESKRREASGGVDPFS